MSVVTVTFNQERYVEQALDSVLAQNTDFPFEIVVSDDHSEDGTADLIRRYAEKYPAVIRPILRPQNVGVAENFLGALRQTRGQYIAMCEGDDFWTDDSKLRRQAALLDERPDLAMCFHPVRVFSEDGDSPDFYFPDPSDRGDFTVERLLRGNFMQTNSAMYRRLEYSRFPVDVMPLDWFLHLYHAKAGEIGFIDRVMAAYRRHAGGVWFGTHEDRPARMRRFGHSQLGFCEATFQLFAGRDVDFSAIHWFILDTLRDLEAADRADGSELLQAGIARYPRCAEVALRDLLAQSRELESLATARAELESTWTRERRSLQTQVYRLENRAEKLERQREQARQDARAVRQAMERTLAVRVRRLLGRNLRRLRSRT